MALSDVDFEIFWNGAISFAFWLSDHAGNAFETERQPEAGDFWDGTIKSEKLTLLIKIRNICGDETVTAGNCYQTSIEFILYNEFKFE
jgi:hypothetical protein